MPYGLNPVIANQELDALLSGAGFTSPAGCFAQLHVGDPGIGGLNNVSSTTTRVAATWASAVGGSKSISSALSWGAWAGASPETIVGLSFWSAASAGTFLFSVQLTASVTVQTGNPLQLSTLTYTRGPLAA